ncbi:hypothetical protein [Nocardioides pyridinolyticus]
MSTAAQLRTRTSRIAEVAVERARLTVVPRRRARASRMPFVALVSMVLLGGVVGLLLFNTSMQQASFAATALETQATTLSARQQALEMDLDRLRDPQRIAGAAVKLGMVQACNPAFLPLGSGEVSGEPVAAGACNSLRINPLPPTKPPVLDPKPNVVTVQGTASTQASTQASTESTSDTGRQNRGNDRERGENRR